MEHQKLWIRWRRITYARYLYSINCPTVICLPSMSLFILWRDTTSELWTPVQFPLYCYYRLLLLALFTFLHTTTIAFHSIRLLLCLQQTGEIDNLIVSWEWYVQFASLFCIIIYCYSLIYFIFRYDTYVISFVFTCLLIIGGVAARVRILLKKDHQETIFWRSGKF
jgi:hypothetical protein